MTDYATFTRDYLIAEIKALKQTIETRVKKMTNENNREYIEDVVNNFDKLKEENTRFREALSYYGNLCRWKFIDENSSYSSKFITSHHGWYVAKSVLCGKRFYDFDELPVERLGLSRTEQDLILEKYKKKQPNKWP